MINKHSSIIFLLLAGLLLSGCFGKRTTQAVQYAEEEAIPYKIAVLPAEYIKHAENSTEHKSVLVLDDDRVFVADISRAAITNQLAGKGFMPLQKDVVDNTLAELGRDEGWRKLSDVELCKLLGADGIVKTDIYSADMIKALAFDLFQLDAEVMMYNAAGTLVGKWRDSASKRRISVPTGVVGLAGTIVEEVFSDPIRRQMRMVVYDWAWNMAQVLPDCPKGPKLPEVIAVDTNVDNRLFGVGQKIAVRVDAEPGLKCSFDIGDFRKNIPLPQTAQGVYEGFYVVREGDKSANETLMVRMRKANGVDRLWPESGSLITLDGQLPPVVKTVEFQTGRDGIQLFWEVPAATDLDEFVIEKGAEPVGEYEVVSRTRTPEFVDPDVMQGNTVFYRVRIKDKAGNMSPLNGVTEVIMPQFDERELFGELSGVLVKGNYRIAFPVTVPEGVEFSIQFGTKIRFEDKGRIDVSGSFQALGEISSPVRLESNSTEGIKILPGGKAVLSQCEFSGFSKAVTAAGGYAELRSSSFSGGEYAVAVTKTGNYDFQGLRINDVRQGLLLSAGNGTVLRSSINNCTRGIVFSGGNAEIKDNNLFDNKINLLSSTKLVVSDNFFGTASRDHLNIKGDILVKSILDAPYPHGRRIILVDDQDITPEELEKKFAKLKEQGVSAFHSQHYGDAYQALNQALKMKDDRDVYLYLSYTLLALGDDLALSETMSEGISKFPYDVRLHQLYVRYLLNKGDLRQARQVLDKALLLSPADSNLLYMKDYLDHLAAPADSSVEPETAPEQKDDEKQVEAMPVKEKPEAENSGAVKPEDNKDEQ
ncbi:right-handed parallel beta-helix repeat-containing protein [Desulfovibrio sp. JC010]|uniref:right-handed parallel beta-helix repeat-containing protein n=1 Tax=Desulfovibrio sp. JC010 TaxID=2593641 RepID=UPI0013D5B507|nr:right-handed parallel beta-helix repeat-containing protein [Desulfovibrio sp. JC010]NDV26357.1 right-handed parallel beta-helix repeat-containing protein [Desulfovibrio sp. JC010]